MLRCIALLLFAALAGCSQQFHARAPAAPSTSATVILRGYHHGNILHR